MSEQNEHITKRWSYLGLLLVAAFTLALKLNALPVGGPYVTIDDQTMYEGGFLVWFGQAPPQRMYLESWVGGLVSISTYAARALASGETPGLNLVADAYRDFYHNPDAYVSSYRSVMLLVDLLTAFMVFLTVRQIFRNARERDQVAALATAFYLLSYNTLWCYVVARPDTLMSFFAVLGLWLYYRSDFGERRSSFLWSGVSFGIATGMKLHGALFVVFIVIDMWRQLGFRASFGRLFAFGGLAVISFSVAAGSVLFDPLLYIKLRLLNARDDASPWLAWGDQFVAILKGSGWLLVPVAIITAVVLFKRREWHEGGRLKSLVLLALLWLLLFSAIRVLRPYWMLPALPLFYALAAYGLSRPPRAHWRYPVVVLALGLMAWQSVAQMRAFTTPPFNQLRAWIVENVEPDDGFYVLGYSAVNLPKSTRAIRQHSAAINDSLQAAIADGESFTERHIRLWEERSRLQLYDMLNFQTSNGYHYQSYHLISPDDLPGGNLRTDMRYVLHQEHFSLAEETDVRRELDDHFRVVGRVVGPGGGGDGLSYTIYQRVEFSDVDQ